MTETSEIETEITEIIEIGTETTRIEIIETEIETIGTEIGIGIIEGIEIETGDIKIEIMRGTKTGERRKGQDPDHDPKVETVITIEGHVQGHLDETLIANVTAILDPRAALKALHQPAVVPSLNHQVGKSQIWQN